MMGPVSIVFKDSIQKMEHVQTAPILVKPAIQIIHAIVATLAIFLITTILVHHVEQDVLVVVQVNTA